MTYGWCVRCQAVTPQTNSPVPPTHLVIGSGNEGKARLVEVTCDKCKQARQVDYFSR